MSVAEIVHFGDQAVEITPHPDHDFLVTNAEVAALYEVKVDNVNKARRRNPEDLREGRQFLVVGPKDNLSSGRRGNATEILWTKRGAIRLSQHIKSPRSTAVQDWLEDLAIRELATRGPEINYSSMVTELGRQRADFLAGIERLSNDFRAGLGELSASVELRATKDELEATKLDLAVTRADLGVALDELEGHKIEVDDKFEKTKVYLMDIRGDVNRYMAQAPVVEEPRITGYQFTRSIGRHEIDRGHLGLLAEKEAAQRGLPHEMRDVTYYRGGVGQVHAWPESTWRAALVEYDRRRMA